MLYLLTHEKGLHVGSCSPTINVDKGEEYYEKERQYVVNFLKQQKVHNKPFKKTKNSRLLLLRRLF
eukprot:UN10258